MFKIIHATQADQHAEVMASMHRLRHRIFKQRMGWDVPSDGALERDQFDIDETIYLVSVNDQTGDVDGTFRLLPTTGPNMLRDVFPALMGPLPIPANPFIWEMSRLCIDYKEGSLRTKDRGGCTMGHLFACAMEYGWAHGVRELVVVHDRRMAKLTQRLLGFTPTWESGPMEMSGVETTAAQYRIVNPQQFRARVGLSAPLLSDRDLGSHHSSVA